MQRAARGGACAALVALALVRQATQLGHGPVNFGRQRCRLARASAVHGDDAGEGWRPIRNPLVERLDGEQPAFRWDHLHTPPARMAS